MPRSLSIALSIGVLGAAIFLFNLRPEPPQPAPAALTAPPVTQRPLTPPPLFSKDYVEAVRGAISIEPDQAAELERQLKAQPGDEKARMKLMAYYGRADNQAKPESRIRRGEHVLWLIENQPDSEALYSPLAMAQLTAVQEQRADELWKGAVAENDSNAKVHFGAAHFYRERDPQLAGRYLERAAALSPENANFGLQLGLQYAPQVADEVRKGLTDSQLLRKVESSNNSAVIEPVVRVLQSEYNKSLMLGVEDRRFHDAAARLFRRVEALNPQVDRAWVFPQIDPKMIGMFNRPPEDHSKRYEEGAKLIRRLAVSDFPELPDGAAAELRRRGCTIPQPFPLDGPPRNVIKGEFFEKGQTSWAAICSVDGSSDVLVFRTADAKPEAISERRPDTTYAQDLGEGRWFYSRQIFPVGREYIVGHYRAYGGPEPPPVDHQGIDDAFLEKASVTYYWYQGKWLELQGAD